MAMPSLSGPFAIARSVPTARHDRMVACVELVLAIAVVIALLSPAC
jgi:hypothetical protein